MTPRDFVYWLQGYFELSGSQAMNSEQVEIVRNHIALVLKKETPEVTPGVRPLTFGGGIVGLGQSNPQWTWPNGVQASC